MFDVSLPECFPPPIAVNKPFLIFSVTHLVSGACQPGCVVVFPPFFFRIKTITKQIKKNKK